MRKNYTSAPLPFMGQKRNYLKYFKEVLKECPSDATYVDLFGGSGLLSRTVKDYYPEAKVIYNDYDNFRERIEAIPTTNRMLHSLRALLKDIPKGAKLCPLDKQHVVNLFEREKEYVDFITLSSSILFSMNTVKNLDELKKATLYNKVRKSDYCADGYLNDLVIVSTDYKYLHNKHKNNKKVIFLVDPPYLSTDCSTYKNYWKLSDYLDVLKVLEDSKFFYFTSNKSSIIELCEWMETSTLTNPFKGSHKHEMKANTTHNTSYTDIMLHNNYTTTTT